MTDIQTRTGAETSIVSRVEQWCRCQDRQEAGYAEVSRKIDSLGERPQVPDRLKEGLSSIDGIKHEPDKSRGHWTAGNLEWIIDKGGFFYTEVDLHSDEITRKILMSIKPLSSSEMERVRELHEIAARYEKARAEHSERCCAIEDAHVSRFDHIFGDGLEIIAAPSSSIEDLAAKVEIIRRLDLTAGGHDAMEDLLDDILRIAGRAV